MAGKPAGGERPDTEQPPDATGKPTARRMVLGVQLRRLREAAGISRAQAGYTIRGSESKISRIELGRVGLKERDVADLLTMYGIGDPAERSVFLDLLRESNQPGWWHRYTDLMPTWFADFVGLEESAARIHTYELQYVPGLLQTEEYARAITGQGRPRLTEHELERNVALRMRRQKILNRPDAPRLWAIIDEAVLRRPIGGRRVLRAQLERILEFTAMPHVSVQVLPYERSGYASGGSFAVLRFAEAELPDIVYVEHLAGALYLDKLDEIELYGRALDRLAVEAETPDRSRQFLDKVRIEL